MFVRKVLFIFTFFIFSNFVYSQPDIKVNYYISCFLNANKKTIEGREKILLLNNAKSPLNELYFNLTMNSFKDMNTSFFIEAFIYKLKLDLKDSGWTEILSLKIEGNELKDGPFYICSDDWNYDDKTLVKLPLPSPVSPGKSITLEINFLTKLPKMVKDCGYLGDFFLVSGWYPRLSFVEEKEGMLTWSFHQNHFIPSIYSNFADYSVELNIPRNFKVGAVGSKLYGKRVGNRKILKYNAEKVDDFVWVASPSFLEYRESFIPKEYLSPSEFEQYKKAFESDESEGKIDVILLLRPEHKIHRERYFKGIKEALKYFGLAFSPYPYTSITLVDSPLSAWIFERVYSNIIFCKNRIFSPQDSLTLEKEIFESIGFQFFCRFISVNRANEHWLCNGLSTYSALSMLKEAYSEPVYYKYFSFIPVHCFEPLRLPLFGFYFLKLRENWMDSILIEYLKSEPQDLVLKKGLEFESYESYRINSFYKPSLLFYNLERIYGKKKIQLFLGEFFKEYSFRNVKTGDFLQMLELKVGAQAREIFEYFLFNRELVDFRVRDVSNEVVKTGNNENLYISSVVIEKEGRAVFPVEVEIVFENGSRAIEKWEGVENWKRFVYKGKDRIVKVVIDPHEKFLLDSNRFNNSFSIKKGSLPFIKSLILWLIWIGEFLHNLVLFV